MSNYTFEETIKYFSAQIGSSPPEEDVEAQDVELVLDEATIALSTCPVAGSFKMVLDFGLFLSEPSPEHLTELAVANFLGAQTAGCSFCLDEEGETILLKVTTSPGTTPQENWDWLHRIVSVADNWAEKMEKWDEVDLLVKFPQREKDSNTGMGFRV